MSRPAIVAGLDTTLEEVARLLLDNGIGCVPLVDDAGAIQGIVTESDFSAKEHGVPFSTFRWPKLLGEWLAPGAASRIYDAARSTRAEEVMSKPPITVNEDHPLEEVIELMVRHQIHRVPVVRDRVPVGIVSRHDLLRVMARRLRDDESG